MRVFAVAVSVLLLSNVRAGDSPLASSAAGTKENPIPITVGQKLTGRLDDNSPRSWGNRQTFYRLSALKGQTIVIGYECDIHRFYGCLYSGVIPEKSLAYQVEPVDAPLSKAFRYTLRRDNPRLEVWSSGSVDYTIVVLEGAPGETLWAETIAARTQYSQAVARQKAERSADRAALLGAVMQGVAQGTAEAYSARTPMAAPTEVPPAASGNAAAPAATPAATAVKAPVRTAYVMCLIRDDVEKRTYYSQIENLAFPLDRVARKNAAYFKDFVVANHGARADITYLHCDYSFDDRSSLERQQNTNRTIDGRTGFATVQTTWRPQPVE